MKLVRNENGSVRKMVDLPECGGAATPTLVLSDWTDADAFSLYFNLFSTYSYFSFWRLVFSWNNFLLSHKKVNAFTLLLPPWCIST